MIETNYLKGLQQQLYEEAGACLLIINCILPSSLPHHAVSLHQYSCWKLMYFSFNLHGYGQI